jgi:hypothetical protein
MELQIAWQGGVRNGTYRYSKFGTGSMANSLGGFFRFESVRIWYHLKMEFWTAPNASKQQHWFGCMALR